MIRPYAAVALLCCGTAALAAAPTDAALGNLAYRGIHGATVTLRDGRYEGARYVEGGLARPVVTLHPAPRLRIDLDGDGVEETVVVLTATSGGSGEFTYLAVVDSRGGKLENIATVGLGDRVMLKRLLARDARLVAEFVAAGPDDPSCCPTQVTESVYALKDNALVRDANRVLGSLSPADLAGSWRLLRIGSEDLPPAVLVTAEFTPGRVSGRGGCNRYFGSVSGSGADDLHIGALGSTRMACPGPADQVETRYFSALGSVSSIRFVLGRLALPYAERGSSGLLLYERLP